MKKTIASVLLLLLAWFSWPLWTALQIREAVLSGDTAVLERKVDWPGVRASLKQSLPVYLAGQGLIGADANSPFRHDRRRYHRGFLMFRRPALCS